MGNVDAGVMVEGQYLTLGGGRALEARQRHLTAEARPSGANLEAGRAAQWTGQLTGREAPLRQRELTGPIRL